MTKNTFLICLDGSEGSKECLYHLSRLLKPQDEVLLMTVVKANDKDDAKAKAGNMFVLFFFVSFLSFFFFFFFSFLSPIFLPLPFSLVNGQENIHKLFPDIKVEHYIENNVDPREAILKQAQNLAVDFIVVGSRGLSGLEKVRLGSVSEYVVRHSECPVIVARPKGY